jgi:hypothetical protein
MESGGMSPIVWVVLAALAAVAVFFVWRRKAAQPAAAPSRTINSTVAGVTTEDERGLSPQQVIVNLQSGDRLKLVAVEHDGAPAVQVQERGGGHVGWLQDGVSDQVRAALDGGKRVDCRISDITGGTRGNPNFGVSIRIDVY